MFVCSAVNSDTTGSSVDDVVVSLREHVFFLNSYIGDAGNTPLVGDGTPLGRDNSRYPRECQLYTLAGWLGRVSTTLHCTHHVSTRRLKRHQSDFSSPSLALWLARCPLQPGKLQWAWLAGHSSTSSGVSSVKGMRALPWSGNSTGTLSFCCKGVQRQLSWAMEQSLLG